MNFFELLRRILTDVRMVVSFSTILPVGSAAPVGDGEVARASWALPVAGLLVGLAGAAINSIARGTGLAPGPAAMLAMAATIILTGAIHEDGLADTADGFGGGRTRDQKLEIMRDSRIGAYGACALFISIGLRWSALASIAEPALVATALLVAHAVARAVLPGFMWLIPLARSDGLSAGAGRPPRQSAIIALGLGTLCLLCGLGPSRAIVGLILLALVGSILARLAVKQVGGQTGDIVGALEQISEIAIMLLAAALFELEPRP
jgi:adenosylcobinamide-GDP ribazoletransferase